MYCQECGAWNDEGCRFCTSCGAQLEDVLAPGDMRQAQSLDRVQAPEPVAYAPVMSDEPAADSTTRLPVIAAAIVAIVAIVAVALVLVVPSLKGVGAAGEGGDDAAAEASATTAEGEGSHMVTLVAGESDEGARTIVEVKPGEDLTLPECSFANEGHTFCGWRDEGGNVLQPGERMSVSGDTSLTAVWEARECTVRFLGAGADGGAMTPLTAAYGSDVTLPTCSFTRAGYVFDAWVDEAGASYQPGESLHVNADTVVTASWRTESVQESVPESAQPSQTTVLSTATLPRTWQGSYEGYTLYTADGVINRAVTIELTSVNANGSLAGIVYVGEREMIEGATYGSYNCEGTIDWDSGYIHLWGTTWVDQGGLIGVGGFRGTVDLGSRSISGQWYDPEGEAEPGDWYVRAI